MALTETQIASLTTEIQTDPQTYGYAAAIADGNDQVISDLLNKPRDGTDGEAAISVRRPDMRPVEILQAIDIDDLPSIQATPTAAQQVAHHRNHAYLTALFGIVDNIRLMNDDGSDTQIRSNLIALFGPGTGTRTRLSAVEQRVGSRSEQLFGSGVRVTIEDVARALGRV